MSWSTASRERGDALPTMRHPLLLSDLPMLPHLSHHLVYQFRAYPVQCSELVALNHFTDVPE